MIFPVFLPIWLAPAGITISSSGAGRIPRERDLDPTALEEHHDLIDFMDEVRPGMPGGSDHISQPNPKASKRSATPFLFMDPAFAR